MIQANQAPRFAEPMPPDLQQALQEAIHWPADGRHQRITYLTNEAARRGIVRRPSDTSQLEELRADCARRAGRIGL